MVGSKFMQMGSILFKFYQKWWIFIYFTSHNETPSSISLPLEKITFCEQVWYFIGWKLLHRVHLEQRVNFKLYFNDSASFVEIFTLKQRANTSCSWWRRNARWSHFALGQLLQRYWMVWSTLSKLARIKV